jgi:hypothetical protein
MKRRLVRVVCYAPPVRVNKAQISPPHQAKCPPLPPEDGRFDPTSTTSIASS